MCGTEALYSLPVVATVVTGGGIMGFVKAKSKASLIAGVVSGILLLGAFLAGRQTLSTGLIAGAVISVLLCLVFAKRWHKTRVFMPAGLMLLICVGESILLTCGIVSP